MPAPTYHLHLRLTVSAPMPWTLYQPWTPWSMHLKKLVNIYLNGLVKTIPKIYMCWGIVSYTNFTNFHQFSPIFWPIFWKYSENVNGLDKMIPKIYICWGIVGYTNFTNFHQFSLFFTNFQTNFLKMFRKYYWARQNDFKNIYMLGYFRWYQFHKFSPNFTNFHQFWWHIIDR